MLKDLEIKYIYDSSESDIIKDLFIPLLSKSIYYYRGVGYFSSGWLKIASKGILNFIKNKGKAHFITSPMLAEKDWLAFKIGNEAIQNELLKKTLLRNIENIETEIENNTLNILAWLISDKILNFFFAIPKYNISTSDYHDKVGIFIDSNQDFVAIHGSFNDSIKGSLNGEAFSVFKSWEKANYPYAQKHKKRLFELIYKGNNQFFSYSIPEIIEKKLIKLRTTKTRPYDFENKTKIYFKDKKNKIKLYDYQEKAIQKWIENNCTGIFEMATGTGKTYTSLAAANYILNKNSKICLIILVPFLHLIPQWEKNVHDFNFISPILCSSNHKNWKINLLSKIQEFNIKIINKICIIVTHNTASSKNFLSIINYLLHN